MTSIAPIISMSQRYARALRSTGPKIAAEMPGGAPDGYWIGENLFYFLAERIEPSIGRIVSIPSIANSETDSVEEIIPLKVLADVLSTQSSQPVDLEILSAAGFEMPNRATLAVSIEKQNYLVDWRRRCVTEVRVSLEVPALYSPDGRYACFVKGHDIWLNERDTGIERPLTTDGIPHYCYGQESEAGLSAIPYRQRPYPVGLWSPDSQWFLTHQIDERSVPEAVIIQHAPPRGGRPVLHGFKYPMSGDRIPLATHVAIHIPSGRVVKFADFPLTVTSLRMAWFSGVDTVWFVRRDRYCKRADLISLDLVKGTGRIVLSETVTLGYIDLHTFWSGTPNVRTLAKSNEVMWFSERDGWGHLYLYNASTGVLKNQITSGKWLVRDLVDVDEAQRKILFLASGIDPETDPARRSLCTVNFDGSGFEVLVTHEGDIFVPVTDPRGLGQDRPFRPSYAKAGISPDCRFGAVRYLSVNRGNLTEIVDLRKRHGFTIASALPTANEMLPRHFTALAADGVTRLHGVMFFPSDFDESRCYPLIDCIYPGPQTSHQPQSFYSVGSATARSLAELGFVTIMLDTRGIPIGSRAFHQISYGAMLEPQLADHAAVVRQLCERHSFIACNRAGMMGHSMGGAATARALFDYGDVFKVGVASSGGYNVDLSSAAWSDKYRGPDGRETWAEWANSAVAHKLEGKLLLISGDLDENVLVSQTLRLVDALIQANRDFDLLIVPNAAHNVLISANGYAQRRAWDYFVRNLLGETPPQNFEITFEPHELERFKKRSLNESRR